MNQTEKKLDAIMNYLGAQDDESRAKSFDVLLNMASNKPNPSAALEEVISQELTQLGVPCHIIGHRYLAMAVKIAVLDPTAVHMIVKKLYADTAKACDTTPSRAERAIRHAIELCWDRGDWDDLHDYFGNTISKMKGKPTNSEFIAKVSDTIRRKMA